MLEAIAHPLGVHRRRLESLLEDAHGWSADGLRWRPSAGQWCALDVLDHLARTEQAIAERMLDGLRSPQAIPLGDRARTAVVLAVMAAPTRVRTPAGAEVVLPQTLASLAEADARLREAHLRLTEAAVAVTRDSCGAGVFHHPVGGWMTPATTVRFVAMHLRHPRVPMEAAEGSALLSRGAVQSLVPSRRPSRKNTGGDP